MQLTRNLLISFNACLAAASRLSPCLCPVQLLSHFWDLASLEEVSK